MPHRSVERRGFDAAAAEAQIKGVTLMVFATPTATGSPRRVLTGRQIADARGNNKTSTSEICIQRLNSDQATRRSGRAMSA